MHDYSNRLHARICELKTPALVGLDPRWNLLPRSVRDAVHGGDSVQSAAFERFCCQIIDIVAPLVPAVKPQVAFFEQLGAAGMAALSRVIRYARDAGLIVIADAKRGDIGSTASAYASAWMAGNAVDAAPFAADAVTVNAYLGKDSLEPFVTTAVERGAAIYVLVRTSNPGATDLQDLTSDGVHLYERVADLVESLNCSYWPGAEFGGVGAVVGATWPRQLSDLRRRMPHVPFLVPGYGSQGGTAKDVAGAFAADGLGALINSSRAINFAWQRPEYAEEFGEDRWQDAVEAATRQMISDLNDAVSA